MLSSQYNSGIGLIDMTKINKNTELFLSDYRALLWEPEWIEYKVQAIEDEMAEKG